MTRFAPSRQYLVRNGIQKKNQLMAQSLQAAVYTGMRALTAVHGAEICSCFRGRVGLSGPAGAYSEGSIVGSVAFLGHPATSMAIASFKRIGYANSPLATNFVESDHLETSKERKRSGTLR